MNSLIVSFFLFFNVQLFFLFITHAQKDTFKKLGVSACYCFILLLYFYIPSPPLIALMYIIFSFFCFFWFYKKILVVMTLLAFYYSISYIANICSFQLFTFITGRNLWHEDYSLSFLLILSLFELTFWLSFAIFWYYENKVHFIQLLTISHKKEKTFTFLFVAVSIITIILNGFSYMKQNSIHYIVAFISFLLINNLILYLIYFIHHQIKEEKMQYLMEDNRSYQTIADNLLNWKHDIKGLLLTIRVLIEQQEIKKAIELMQEFVSTINEIKNPSLLATLAKIEFLPLRSLISEKIAEMEAEKILFTLVCKKPFARLRINTVDLIRVMSIILDNAKEAAREVDEKQVELRFERKKDELVILLLNTAKDTQYINVDKILKKNVSTKAKHLGRGLYSLAQILNSYKQIKWCIRTDQRFFYMSIIIPI